MTITATCSCCGRTATHELTDLEEFKFDGYMLFGREFGKLQDLFPDVPAWIRSGAMDKYNGGFCICPECGEEAEKYGTDENNFGYDYGRSDRGNVQC